jgi:Protein of unknown function (DUF1553)
VLKPGAQQQLLVHAYFNDNHAEDVTRWAKFNDANSAVTQVDDLGNVKVVGQVEGAITAWFLSKIATATVTVPYDNQVPPDTFVRATRRNFIDNLVLDKLRQLNLPPSPETYQRSSQPLPENTADTRFYSRYYPRRLNAEVLLDAYSQVTGVPSEFVTDLRNQNRGLGDKYPLGYRAQQLPDTKTFSFFLKTFGRPEREKTCECERSATPSMAQVLHIANGDTVNQKLAAKDNVISSELRAGLAPQDLVGDAYLAALARPPTDIELEKMAAAVKLAPEDDRRAAVEDVYWAILSSKEFLFNH